MPPTMHAQQLYEYAVIRFVPHVEREEFLNVGVIVFCKALKKVEMRYFINAEKILAFAPQADINRK
jgi:hypothetical protein